MKKLLLLFFLLAFIKIEAQQNRGIEKSGVRRGFYASFSAGLTSPTGDYKTYSDEVTNADGQVLFGATEKITGKSQFNLDAGYQFGAFGLGLSIGSFSHELSELSFQSDLFDTNFPILQNGGAIDGTYYGTGPDYRLAFGKFSTTASARIGLMDFSTDTFTGSYNGTDTDVPLELIRTEFASDGKTSLGYTSIGLKLSYDISKQLSLFTKTDYFITLSDGLQVTDSGVLLHDINNDKLITAADFDFAGPGLETFINERFTKPKMVNVGFGLTWNFNAPQKGKAVNADGPKNQKSKIKGGLDGKGNMKMETGIINSGETVDIKGIGDKKTVKLIVPVAINKGLRVDDAVDEDSDDDGLSDSLEISDGVDNDCDSDSSSTKRMNKEVLIETIAKDANLSKADAGNALNAITSHLSESLKKGKAAQLIGSGGISISARRRMQDLPIQRTGRNPQTGKEIKIAAKKVAKFKAGKALADVVKRTDNSQDPQGNSGEIQMNKGKLVDAIAKDANLSKADAGNALNAFLSILSEELNNGNCVKLIVPVAINKGLKQGKNNGSMVDTSKRVHLKELADELVNAVDLENDSLKPSAKVEVRGWDPKDKSTIPNPKKRKSIIKGSFDGKDNMKMETGIINDDGQKKRKLIAVSPNNNSHFKSATEIENFTWEVIGDKIPNPQYIIEIIKTGSNQQPQRTYIGKTTDSKIAAKKVAKFRAGKALADVVKRTGNPNQGNDDDLDSDGLADTVKTTDGQQQTAGEGFYSWKVTETTTGISSNLSFFTIREGGRTVEAGQVPEKTASNGSDDMGDEQNDTKRAADLKKLADELVNAFAIDDVIWSSNINHNIEMPPRDIDKPFLMKEETAVSKRSRDKSTNPIAEEENQRASGDLKNIFPPGNKKGTGSRFKNLSEITYFAWEIIGADIPNAEYVVEITKIDNDGQPQQTFIGKSTQRNGRNPQTGKEIKIAAKKVAKFKAGKALADVVKRTVNNNQANDDDLDSDGLADTVKTTDGQQQTAGEGFYSWKVTEITTGISSAPSFFTVSDSETTEDCLGYQKNSAMMIVKIDETSLRNTNTVIDNPEDILAKKRHERMGIRALRAKDARHGYRAKQNDARMKDARMKDVRMKDVRMKDARIQNIADKPFEITTEESDKVAPQIDINTKYIRALNHKTIEISKSYLQLIAPILSCKNNILNYNWTVKNKALNIGDSFSGNTVKYDFNVEGVYEINIMPTLNNKNLNAFSIIIICK